MISGLRLGIDASNLLGGGGVTHLQEILNAAEPSRHGVAEVLVWAGKATLSRLPQNRHWLRLIHEPLLDRGIPARLWWRRTIFPSEVRRQCDLLLVPGGLPGTAGIPWVTMCRNMLPFEQEERRRYRFGFQRARLEVLRLAQSRAFQGADGLIFLTEYARAAVCRQLREVPRHVAVIPHGVDLRFVRVPSRSKGPGEYDAEHPLKLLYVSTVNVYKHQWNVAEAVARLRSRGWPLRLDLIGGGYEPALSRLRSAIERLDPKREWLSYHGPVPFEGLHNRYHSADAFVFASSCENMPNILLEAMAAGLPIACSERSPMPEILGSAGEYFDPERPDTIADAVERLLIDPRRSEVMAEGACARAKQYSWVRCASETFAFLRYVYEKSRGGTNVESRELKRIIE